MSRSINCTLHADGGVSNGIPIFKDNLRPQIIVEPITEKLPSKSTHVMSYDLKRAELAFRLGQDDAVLFLKNPEKKLKSIYQKL